MELCRNGLDKRALKLAKKKVRSPRHMLLQRIRSYVVADPC